MRKWAAEVASRARFASALPPEDAAANPGSLPVPCLVVNNKADLRGRQSSPSALEGRFLAVGVRADSCLSKLRVTRRLLKKGQERGFARAPVAAFAISAILRLAVLVNAVVGLLLGPSERGSIS